MSAEPLFDAFQQLRRQRFALGVKEYLLAREALACGFGTPSRAELILVCQTLWAKTLEQQRIVASVVNAHLPQAWTPKTSPEPETPAATPPPPPRAPVAPDATPPAVSSAAATEALPQTAGAGRAALAVTAGPAMAVAPVADATSPRWRRTFDLRGEPPVSLRHMERAWRYYRRMRRVGAPVILDLEATLEQTHRLGIFAGPVLIPPRRNLARLLMLADVGGSMAPFAREIAPLAATAREAGLVLASCLHFHDVPGPMLFRDTALMEGVELKDAAEPFTAAGVLIVSDAGAARGRLDPERASATAIQLDRLHGITPNIAWINPMPPERWPGTTAGEIARFVEMFTFDRTGLDRAVGVLRGQRRR